MSDFNDNIDGLEGLFNDDQNPIIGGNPQQDPFDRLAQQVKRDQAASDKYFQDLNVKFKTLTGETKTLHEQKMEELKNSLSSSTVPSIEKVEGAPDLGTTKDEITWKHPDTGEVHVGTYTEETKNDDGTVTTVTMTPTEDGMLNVETYTNKPGEERVKGEKSAGDDLDYGDYYGNDVASVVKYLDDNGVDSNPKDIAAYLEREKEKANETDTKDKVFSDAVNKLLEFNGLQPIEDVVSVFSKDYLYTSNLQGGFAATQPSMSEYMKIWAESNRVDIPEFYVEVDDEGETKIEFFGTKDQKLSDLMWSSSMPDFMKTEALKKSIDPSDEFYKRNAGKILSSNTPYSTANRLYDSEEYKSMDNTARNRIREKFDDIISFKGAYLGIQTADARAYEQKNFNLSKEDLAFAKEELGVDLSQMDERQYASLVKQANDLYLRSSGDKKDKAERLMKRLQTDGALGDFMKGQSFLTYTMIQDATDNGRVFDGFVKSMAGGRGDIAISQQWGWAKDIYIKELNRRQAIQNDMEDAWENGDYIGAANKAMERLGAATMLDTPVRLVKGVAGFFSSPDEDQTGMAITKDESGNLVYDPNVIANMSSTAQKNIANPSSFRYKRLSNFADSEGTIVELSKESTPIGSFYDMMGMMDSEKLVVVGGSADRKITAKEKGSSYDESIDFSGGMFMIMDEEGNFRDLTAAQKRLVNDGNNQKDYMRRTDEKVATLTRGEKLSGLSLAGESTIVDTVAIMAITALTGGGGTAPALTGRLATLGARGGMAGRYASRMIANVGTRGFHTTAGYYLLSGYQNNLGDYYTQYGVTKEAQKAAFAAATTEAYISAFFGSVDTGKLFSTATNKLGTKKLIGDFFAGKVSRKAAIRQMKDMGLDNAMEIFEELVIPLTNDLNAQLTGLASNPIAARDAWEETQRYRDASTWINIIGTTAYSSGVLSARGARAGYKAHKDAITLNRPNIQELLSRDASDIKQQASELFAETGNESINELAQSIEETKELYDRADDKQKEELANAVAKEFAAKSDLKELSTKNTKENRKERKSKENTILAARAVKQRIQAQIEGVENADKQQKEGVIFEKGQVISTSKDTRLDEVDDEGNETGNFVNVSAGIYEVVENTNNEGSTIVEDKDTGKRYSLKTTKEDGKFLNSSNMNVVREKEYEGEAFKRSTESEEKKKYVAKQINELSLKTDRTAEEEVELAYLKKHSDENYGTNYGYNDDSDISKEVNNKRIKYKTAQAIAKKVANKEALTDDEAAAITMDDAESKANLELAFQEAGLDFNASFDTSTKVSKLNVLHTNSNGKQVVLQVDPKILKQAALISDAKERAKFIEDNSVENKVFYKKDGTVSAKGKKLQTLDNALANSTNAINESIKKKNRAKGSKKSSEVIEELLDMAAKTMVQRNNSKDRVNSRGFSTMTRSVEIESSNGVYDDSYAGGKGDITKDKKSRVAVGEARYLGQSNINGMHYVRMASTGEILLVEESKIKELSDPTTQLGVSKEAYDAAQKFIDAIPGSEDLTDEQKKAYITTVLMIAKSGSENMGMSVEAALSSIVLKEVKKGNITATVAETIIEEEKTLQEEGVAEEIKKGEETLKRLLEMMGEDPENVSSAKIAEARGLMTRINNSRDKKRNEDIGKGIPIEDDTTLGDVADTLTLVDGPNGQKGFIASTPSGDYKFIDLKDRKNDFKILNAPADFNVSDIPNIGQAENVPETEEESTYVFGENMEFEHNGKSYAPKGTPIFGTDKNGKRFVSFTQEGSKRAVKFTSEALVSAMSTEMSMRNLAEVELLNAEGGFTTEQLIDAVENSIKDTLPPGVDSRKAAIIVVAAIRDHNRNHAKTDDLNSMAQVELTSQGLGSKRVAELFNRWNDPNNIVYMENIQSREGAMNQEINYQLRGLQALEALASIADTKATRRGYTTGDVIMESVNIDKLDNFRKQLARRGTTKKNIDQIIDVVNEIAKETGSKKVKLEDVLRKIKQENTFELDFDYVKMYQPVFDYSVDESFFSPKYVDENDEFDYRNLRYLENAFRPGRLNLVDEVRDYLGESIDPSDERFQKFKIGVIDSRKTYDRGNGADGNNTVDGDGGIFIKREDANDFLSKMGYDSDAVFNVTVYRGEGKFIYEFDYMPPGYLGSVAVMFEADDNYSTRVAHDGLFYSIGRQTSEALTKATPYKDFGVSLASYDRDPDYEYSEFVLTTPFEIDDNSHYNYRGQFNKKDYPYRGKVFGHVRGYENKKTGEFIVIEVQSDLYQSYDADKRKERPYLTKESLRNLYNEFMELDRTKDNILYDVEFGYDVLSFHEEFARFVVAKIIAGESPGREYDYVDIVSYISRGQVLGSEPLTDETLQAIVDEQINYEDRVAPAKTLVFNKEGEEFMERIAKGKWANFLVDATVQYAVRNGYTNIKFPVGETAAIVEGHPNEREAKRKLSELLGKNDRKIYELERQEVALEEGDIFPIFREINEYLSATGQTERYVLSYTGFIKGDSSRTEEEKQALESVQSEISDKNSDLYKELKARLDRRRKTFESYSQQVKDDYERELKEAREGNIYKFYDNRIKGILNKYYKSEKVKGKSNLEFNSFDIDDKVKSKAEKVMFQRDQHQKIKGQAILDEFKILIDPKLRTKDTLDHEKAHFYINMFRDTKLVQEAIKKFGGEEELVQYIGEQAVNPNNKEVQEAMNWWKRFSQWLMNLFDNLDQKTKEELGNALTAAYKSQVDIEKAENTFNALKGGKFIERPNRRAKKDRVVFIDPASIDKAIDQLSPEAKAEMAVLMADQGIDIEDNFLETLKEQLTPEQQEEVVTKLREEQNNQEEEVDLFPSREVGDTIPKEELPEHRKDDDDLIDAKVVGIKYSTNKTEVYEVEYDYGDHTQVDEIPTGRSKKLPKKKSQRKNKASKVRSEKKEPMTYEQALELSGVSEVEALNPFFSTGDEAIDEALNKKRKAENLSAAKLGDVQRSKVFRDQQGEDRKVNPYSIKVKVNPENYNEYSVELMHNRTSKGVVTGIKIEKPEDLWIFYNNKRPKQGIVEDMMEKHFPGVKDVPALDKQVVALKNNINRITKGTGIVVNFSEKNLPDRFAGGNIMFDPLNPNIIHVKRGVSNSELEMLKTALELKKRFASTNDSSYREFLKGVGIELPEGKKLTKDVLYASLVGMKFKDEKGSERSYSDVVAGEIARLSGVEIDVDSSFSNELARFMVIPTMGSYGTVTQTLLGFAAALDNLNTSRSGKAARLALINQVSKLMDQYNIGQILSNAGAGMYTKEYVLEQTVLMDQKQTLTTPGPLGIINERIIPAMKEAGMNPYEMFSGYLFNKEDDGFLNAAGLTVAREAGDSNVQLRLNTDAEIKLYDELRKQYADAAKKRIAIATQDPTGKSKATNIPKEMMLSRLKSGNAAVIPISMSDLALGFDLKDFTVAELGFEATSEKGKKIKALKEKVQRAQEKKMLEITRESRVMSKGATNKGSLGLVFEGAKGLHIRKAMSLSERNEILEAPLTEDEQAEVEARVEKAAASARKKTKVNPAKKPLTELKKQVRAEYVKRNEGSFLSEFSKDENYMIGYERYVAKYDSVISKLFTPGMKLRSLAKNGDLKIKDLDSLGFISMSMKELITQSGAETLAELKQMIYTDSTGETNFGFGRFIADKKSIVKDENGRVKDRRNKNLRELSKDSPFYVAKNGQVVIHESVFTTPRKAKTEAQFKSFLESRGKVALKQIANGRDLAIKNNASRFYSQFFTEEELVSFAKDIELDNDMSADMPNAIKNVEGMGYSIDSEALDLIEPDVTKIDESTEKAISLAKDNLRENAAVSVPDSVREEAERAVRGARTNEAGIKANNFYFSGEVLPISESDKLVEMSNRTTEMKYMDVEGNKITEIGDNTHMIVINDPNLSKSGFTDKGPATAVVFKSEEDAKQYMAGVSDAATFTAPSDTDINYMSGYNKTAKVLAYANFPHINIELDNRGEIYDLNIVMSKGMEKENKITSSKLSQRTGAMIKKGKGVEEYSPKERPSKKAKATPKRTSVNNFSQKNFAQGLEKGERAIIMVSDDGKVLSNNLFVFTDESAIAEILKRQSSIQGNPVAIKSIDGPIITGTKLNLDNVVLSDEKTVKIGHVSIELNNFDYIKSASKKEKPVIFKSAADVEAEIRRLEEKIETLTEDRKKNGSVFLNAKTEEEKRAAKDASKSMTEEINDTVRKISELNKKRDEIVALDSGVDIFAQYETEETEGPEATEKELDRALDVLSNKMSGVGVDGYVKYNDPSDNRRGYYDSGKKKVYVNYAHAKADTPFHEYAHPMILGIKHTNKELYKQLISDLEGTERGKQLIASISNQPGYKGLSPMEIREEALVQMIGEQAADNFGGDKSILTRFFDWLKSVLGFRNEVTLENLSSATTIKDLAKFMSNADTIIKVMDGAVENQPSNIDVTMDSDADPNMVEREMYRAKIASSDLKTVKMNPEHLSIAQRVFGENPVLMDGEASAVMSTTSPKTMNQLIPLGFIPAKGMMETNTGKLINKSVAYYKENEGKMTPDELHSLTGIRRVPSGLVIEHSFLDNYLGGLDRAFSKLMISGLNEVEMTSDQILPLDMLEVLGEVGGRVKFRFVNDNIDLGKEDGYVKKAGEEDSGVAGSYNADLTNPVISIKIPGEYMNGSYPSAYIATVMAHEVQHLIQHVADPNIQWFNPFEGSNQGQLEAIGLDANDVYRRSWWEQEANYAAKVSLDKGRNPELEAFEGSTDFLDRASSELGEAYNEMDNSISISRDGSKIHIKDNGKVFEIEEKEEDGTLFQKRDGVEKGSFKVTKKKNGKVVKSLMTLNENSDITTVVHELAHWYASTLSPQQKSEIAGMFGQSTTKWNKEIEEMFAEAVEVAFLKGKIDIPYLEPQLMKMKEAFQDVYGDTNFSKEVKDKMRKFVNGEAKPITNNEFDNLIANLVATNFSPDIFNAPYNDFKEFDKDSYNLRAAATRANDLVASIALANGIDLENITIEQYKEIIDQKIESYDTMLDPYTELAMKAFNYALMNFVFNASSNKPIVTNGMTLDQAIKTTISDGGIDISSMTNDELETLIQNLEEVNKMYGAAMRNSVKTLNNLRDLGFNIKMVIHPDDLSLSRELSGTDSASSNQSSSLVDAFMISSGQKDATDSDLELIVHVNAMAPAQTLGVDMFSTVLAAVAHNIKDNNDEGANIIKNIQKMVGVSSDEANNLTFREIAELISRELEAKRTGSIDTFRYAWVNRVISYVKYHFNKLTGKSNITDSDIEQFLFNLAETTGRFLNEDGSVRTDELSDEIRTISKENGKESISYVHRIDVKPSTLQIIDAMANGRDLAGVAIDDATFKEIEAKYGKEAVEILKEGESYRTGLRDLKKNLKKSEYLDNIDMQEAIAFVRAAEAGGLSEGEIIGHLYDRGLGHISSTAFFLATDKIVSSLHTEDSIFPDYKIYSGTYRDVIRRFFDRNEPIRIIQMLLADSKGALGNNENPYTALELAAERAVQHNQDIFKNIYGIEERDQASPYPKGKEYLGKKDYDVKVNNSALFKRMEKEGLFKFSTDKADKDLDPINKYAILRHIPERIHRRLSAQEAYLDAYKELKYKLETAASYATGDKLAAIEEDLSKVNSNVKSFEKAIEESKSALSNAQSNLDTFKSENASKIDMMDSMLAEFKEQVIDPYLKLRREAGLLNEESYNSLKNGKRKINVNVSAESLGKDESISTPVELPNFEAYVPLHHRPKGPATNESIGEYDAGAGVIKGINISEGELLKVENFSYSNVYAPLDNMVTSTLNNSEALILNEAYAQVAKTVAENIPGWKVRELKKNKKGVYDHAESLKNGDLIFYKDGKRYAMSQTRMAEESYHEFKRRKENDQIGKWIKSLGAEKKRSLFEGAIDRMNKAEEKTWQRAGLVVAVRILTFTNTLSNIARATFTQLNPKFIYRNFLVDSFTTMYVRLDKEFRDAGIKLDRRERRVVRRKFFKYALKSLAQELTHQLTDGSFKSLVLGSRTVKEMNGSSKANAEYVKMREQAIKEGAMLTFSQASRAFSKNDKFSKKIDKENFDQLNKRMKQAERYGFKKSAERMKSGEVLDGLGDLGRTLWGTAKQPADALFGLVDIFGQSSEMASRMATYQLAKEYGLSNSQSAGMARGVTINFNRKGADADSSGIFRTLLSTTLFLNVALQGVNLMINRQLLDSRIKRKSLSESELKSYRDLMEAKIKHIKDNFFVEAVLPKFNIFIHSMLTGLAQMMVAAADLDDEERNLLEKLNKIALRERADASNISFGPYDSYATDPRVIMPLMRGGLGEFQTAGQESATIIMSEDISFKDKAKAIIGHLIGSVLRSPAAELEFATDFLSYNALQLFYGSSTQDFIETIDKTGAFYKETRDVSGDRSFEVRKEKLSSFELDLIESFKENFGASEKRATQALKVLEGFVPLFRNAVDVGADSRIIRSIKDERPYEGSDLSSTRERGIILDPVSTATPAMAARQLFNKMVSKEAVLYVPFTGGGIQQGINMYTNAIRRSLTPENRENQKVDDMVTLLYQGFGYRSGEEGIKLTRTEKQRLLNFLDVYVNERNMYQVHELVKSVHSEEAANRLLERADLYDKFRGR